MAKQPNNTYKVNVKLVEISDRDDEIICFDRTFYRTGVSEKQVIHRLRYGHHWYDRDNYDGSAQYKYIFKLEKIEVVKEKQDEKPVQLNLFDFDFSND